MNAISLPTVCPRCDRPLVLNHDVRECLTHGEIHAPLRAWENIIPRGPDLADPDLPARRSRPGPAPAGRVALPLRDRQILAGLVSEPTYECEQCYSSSFMTAARLREHVVQRHTTDPEPTDPLRWLAWRVGKGQPISAAIAAAHFDATERQGALWMAGGWARFIGGDA